MSRDIKTDGIILKKVKFRETSWILDVLTPDLGKISIMAKGVRKSNSKNTGMLEILNELDLSLYKNPNSDWYIYKSAQLINGHLFDTQYTNSILMQAAVEVIRQIIIAAEDSKAVYDLLVSYLQYIKNVQKNCIAIFWRFLLKLSIVLGIDFDINNCINCSFRKQFVGYFPQKHGFICQDCYHPSIEEQILNLNSETSKLLMILNEIGNHLETIKISKTTKLQLNNIFITHFSEHFHKKIIVRSLGLLKF